MYVNRMKAHGPVTLANGQRVTINHVDHTTKQTRSGPMETRSCSINHMDCNTAHSHILFSSFFFLFLCLGLHQHGQPSQS